MNALLSRYAHLHLWIGIIALSTFVFITPLNSLLAFDRELILEGQIWRLVTAHLTHLNAVHLLQNMLALLIFSVFFSQYESRTYWLFSVFFIAMLCGTGLLLDGKFAYYSGASGVIHGLFILAAFAEYRHNKLSASVFGLIILGKIVFEQIYGASAYSESLIGASVATNAHLYGVLAALLFIILTAYRNEPNKD